MSAKIAKTDTLDNLTLETLYRWTSPEIVSRGESYGRRRLVEDLVKTPSGAVIASVYGSKEYVTMIKMEDGDLSHICSCPFEGRCKHAVALGIEYIKKKEKGENIPAANIRDERLATLDMEWDGVIKTYGKISGEPVDPRDRLQKYLETKTKDELVDMIWKIADRIHPARQYLFDRIELEAGSVDELVESLLQEIEEVSSETGWRNHWNEEGYTPDYSHIREGLRALLEKGHPDRVIPLGEKIIDRGSSQIEGSNDDGETQAEIESCMPFFFKALAKSSLKPAEKIIKIIDIEFEDYLGITDGAIDNYFDVKFPVEAWSEVADILTDRLEDMGKEKEVYDYGSYNWSYIAGELINALENADRDDEIIPLCKKEAELSGNYNRLVKILINEGKWDEADEWARKGLKATEGKHLSAMRDLSGYYRKIQEKKGDWKELALLLAEDFFREPSLGSYNELLKVSEKAGIKEEVRVYALHYLETEKKPGEGIEKSKGKNKKLPPWPLPISENFKKINSHTAHGFPQFFLLIDIAMKENRNNDLMHWYKGLMSSDRSFYFNNDNKFVIARLLFKSHQEFSIEILKSIPENLIDNTRSGFYGEAFEYLKKIRQILKECGREKEWDDYIESINQKHKRKRNLMKLLRSDNMIKER
ncbi:MAG: hypothetical protein K8T10_03920 [Candidatus Eremiobacteraeota bacterium]|nr:hypothetical protein [Candidatus Eremiobacteraeota bacterium]